MELGSRKSCVCCVPEGRGLHIPHPRHKKWVGSADWFFPGIAIGALILPWNSDWSNHIYTKALKRWYNSGMHISWFRACTCTKFACACTEFCTWTHTKALLALMSIIAQNIQAKTITFFNWMTWTLDLWRWPSNLSEMSSRSIPVPNFVTVP